MSADELHFNFESPYVDKNSRQFELNQLLSSNKQVEDFWGTAYKVIYQANTAIESLEHSTIITDSVSKQLIGEAKFIRAFTYFYLVNFFGDVPLSLNSSYETNANISRTASEKVYELIIDDLTFSRNNLKENYVSGSGTLSNMRVRVNKAAATAMLARVNLYLQDWQSAEQYASEILDNNSVYYLEDIDNAFLLNSHESIWQLMPLYEGAPTSEGENFIIADVNYFAYQLTQSLFQSFDNDDLRKQKWTGTINNGSEDIIYPYKYKQQFYDVASTENSIILRVAEQFLIRAEARAQLNNLNGAKEDLNAIRNRAGLADVSSLSKEGLLVAILNERRHELFVEFGHRWLDLKRTGNLDAGYLSTIKPGWTNDDILYPVPAYEFQTNPNLGSQNNGY